MAMSDCIKCWSTPCCCGWDYKDYKPESLSKHIASITQYRSKEEAQEILKIAIKTIEEDKNWKDSI
jgi:hypothetical protein